MSLNKTTFTHKMGRRRQSATTARAYALDKRLYELDRKSSNDINRMADQTEKRMKELKKILKKGSLSFTRQEMEIQYRKLEDEIWFYTNQAETLRNIGAQADQIIAAEKLISVLTEHQNIIREIVNANIPFQNSIVKDIVAHSKYYLRQRFVINPYKKVAEGVGSAVRANNLGGVILRSVLGAGLNRGTGGGVLRLAAGLSTASAAANVKKLNDKRINLVSPLDLLKQSSRAYNNADNVASNKLEKAKLEEAKKQHKENKEQTETANKIGEEAVNELKKAVKTNEKMVREFQSKNDGSDLVGTALGGLAGLFGLKTVFGGGGGGGIGVAGGMGAAGAAKSVGFLGRWAKRLAVVGGAIGVADLAFNKREDNSKRDFFGDPNESIIESRASSYAAAALGGAALGGPVGAGVGLAVAFIADNWNAIRTFQKEQNDEYLKAIGLLPETITEALDDSKLGKFFSSDAKTRLLEKLGTPLEKAISSMQQTVNAELDPLIQNRAKYPKGSNIYMGRVIGPDNKDYGVVDYRRFERDLTAEEAAQNATFTANNRATVGISYKPASGSGISDRETRAMNYFMEQGYTQAQAAGIVGNLVQESNLNPNGPKGDAGTAHGMAQWRHERFDNLKAFAQRRNGSRDTWTDEQTQLEFIKWELDNTHKDANSALLKAQNYSDAADAIALEFEKPRGAETGNANKIHGIANRRAHAGRFGNIKFEPVVPKTAPIYNNPNIFQGTTTYLNDAGVQGDGSVYLVGKSPANYINEYKAREIKSDLDYFSDDRALRFTPSTPNEPYSIPTFDSPGITPKFEPPELALQLPTTAAPTAAPRTKKDKETPISQGKTFYGMPLLADVPTFDTELGVLILTQQAQ